MAIVWAQQDPAFPEPKGPHCEVCLTWTPDGDLCAACARADLECQAAVAS